MELLQENGRGKSDIPMIMGIIGFIATLPGVVCASCISACAQTTTVWTTGESSSFASTWLIVNIASGALGLFFGIKSKATPRTSGAIMIGVTILTLFLSFITLNWFWGLIAAACFGVGGAISLTQETTNV